jgi:hypothetical protein
MWYRRVGVDHDRAVWAGMHLVRRVRRNRPGVPRPQLPRLVSDPELAGPGDQDPELLVLVAVLWDDAAGIELDEPEGKPLAMHDATRDPIPDLLRLDLAGFFERAQGAIVPRSATRL